MTAPRRIIAGEYYLVTRRTMQRAFLLRPDPEVNRMFEYCLAEAANKFDIELIAWCAMSNHYHSVIYDPYGRAPAFLERFHKMLSKVLSVHLRRFEGIWSKEQTCLTRLVTMNDVFEKVVYVYSNPAAAHIVEDIAQAPGSSSWNRMGRDAKGVARPKPYFCEAGRMPAEVGLRAVVPRGLRGESKEAWIARVRAAVRRRQSNLAKERGTRGVLGAERAMKTDPNAMPKTKAPRWKLRPHLACKEKDRMKAERRALKEFRADYRTMLLRFRAGESRVEFPEGTYRLRLLGLRCKGCNEADAGTSRERVRNPKPSLKKTRGKKKAA